MEIAKDERQTAQEVTSKKGGLRTMPFIIANETLDKVASVGLQANMIMYLQKEYNLSIASGAYILFLWSAISNFMPAVGAFVSDSYFGRFRVIASGTIISLLGMILLWLTAIIPSARPPHCDQRNGNMQKCVSPERGQLLFLFSSFALMAIGTGGIRPCSLAFGADQIDPKNKRMLRSFFNWYYASIGISILISVLAIVAIQDAAGWVVGLGAPAGLMFLSTISFLLGSSLYVKVEANKNLLAGFAQVITAAWKNKNLALPPTESDSHRWYHHKGSKLAMPTDRLRFLNKACFIINPEKDLDSEEMAIDPWKLCPVKRVEELKALLKVLPIWSSNIMVAVTLNQQAFPVLQASTMDRHFIGKLKIPAGSYLVFTLITLTIWVAIYDRILVPLLAKFMNRPRGLSNKERMGIGIVISCLSTVVAAVVENERRATAFKQGLENHPRAVVDMSANWLLLQYCLAGLAEAFNAIGQIEFYYSQFPKTMASVAVALFSVGTAVANLVGSLIVRIVVDMSTKGGNVSWVSNNLNKGHYDYYYCILTLLSVGNFFYFLLCCWAYGSCEDNNIWDQEETMEKVEMIPSVRSPMRHVDV